MIGLVFKNIKNSLRAYRGIYGLLIITQIIAVIILFFVYGTVVSYDMAREEKRSENLGFYAYFDERVAIYNLPDELKDVLENVEPRLKYIAAIHKNEEIQISFIQDYHNGRLYIDEESFGTDRLTGGRYMTEEEINNGSKVVVGNEIGELGDTINLGNEEFEIIGTISGMENFGLMSFRACPKELTTRMVVLEFNQFPTQFDYDIFVTTIKSHYGNKVQFSEFEPMNVDDIIAYNSIIVLALAIGVVAALDTILVYNYIMKKRKKQMAIFGINGANTRQQIFINEMEVVIITVFTAIIGVAAFRFFIEKTLMEVYEIGISIFSIKVYGIMLLAYAGCIILGTLVMTIINTRRKVLEMRRG